MTLGCLSLCIVALFCSPLLPTVLFKHCVPQPTAKEVFLDMLVDHLSQLVGGVGTVVPWHNVRLALFPKKVQDVVRPSNERPPPLDDTYRKMVRLS